MNRWPESPWPVVSHYASGGVWHDADGPCGPPPPGAPTRTYGVGDGNECPDCVAVRPTGPAPLLAIDLGVRYVAAAAFREKRLVAASLVAPGSVAEGRWTPRVPEVVAEAAIGWALGVLRLGVGPVLAIEVPQDYAGRSAPARDLARMRLVRDELHRSRARRWPAVVPGATREPTPGAWKGNVPKHVHEARILGALDARERRILAGRDHNVVDAVGLGLFCTGRLLRGGVRPRD